MKQRIQLFVAIGVVAAVLALAGCGEGGTQKVETGDSAGETVRQVDQASGNDQLGANQAQSE